MGGTGAPAQLLPHPPALPPLPPSYPAPEPPHSRQPAAAEGGMVEGGVVEGARAPRLAESGTRPQPAKATLSYSHLRLQPPSADTAVSLPQRPLPHPPALQPGPVIAGPAPSLAEPLDQDPALGGDRRIAAALRRKQQAVVTSALALQGQKQGWAGKGVCMLAGNVCVVVCICVCV